MSDSDGYSYGDGHTDEELQALDELYGVDTGEGRQLSELEEQLLEEGWTTAGVAWLHAAAEFTSIDELDLGVFARGLVAPYVRLEALVDDDPVGVFSLLYRYGLGETSPEVADQPDEQADDRQHDQDDNDRRETSSEIHAPTVPSRLFSQDTPGVGGVPLAINDAGVSTRPSAAS